VTPSQYRPILVEKPRQAPGGLLAQEKNMEFIETEFSGLWIVRPKVFRDERGFFLESFRMKAFAERGLERPFVQANHARSEAKGVLRGMHFQVPPMAQAKLVRVTKGAVLDVVADLRQGSSTFGRSYSIALRADEFTQLYIPRGFAHGYLTLEEGTEFQYMVDQYYSPEHEQGIAWNDPALGVDWGEVNPILCDRDRNFPRLKNFSTPFLFDLRP
jgi:dTDP-4-dehydrorhamnose 3,5-epimerase